MNILIVENDSGMRTVLSSLITRAKHSVTAAVDGTRGLQCISEATTPFDLIITDHNMPRMSGSEFVRRLRETCPLVKVIVFSSTVSSDEERDYHSLGVQKVLTKPLGIKELVQILEVLS